MVVVRTAQAGASAKVRGVAVAVRRRRDVVMKVRMYMFAQIRIEIASYNGKKS